MSLFFCTIERVERLQNVEWKLHEITRSFEHVAKHALLQIGTHCMHQCVVVRKSKCTGFQCEGRVGSFRSFPNDFANVDLRCVCMVMDLIVNCKSVSFFGQEMEAAASELKVFKEEALELSRAKEQLHPGCHGTVARASMFGRC